MNLSYLVVPHELSDEAAAHLSETLNDLAVVFDGQYFRSDPDATTTRSAMSQYRTLVPRRAARPLRRRRRGF